MSHCHIFSRAASYAALDYLLGIFLHLDCSFVHDFIRYVWMYHRTADMGIWERILTPLCWTEGSHSRRSILQQEGLVHFTK